MKKKTLSMNQIMILSLTAIVVGILGCAIAFFLQTYQRSLIRNAQTAISPISARKRIHAATVQNRAVFLPASPGLSMSLLLYPSPYAVLQQTQSPRRHRHEQHRIYIGIL